MADQTKHTTGRGQPQISRSVKLVAAAPETHRGSKRQKKVKKKSGQEMPQQENPIVDRDWDDALTCALNQTSFYWHKCQAASCFPPLNLSALLKCVNFAGSYTPPIYCSPLSPRRRRRG